MINAYASLDECDGLVQALASGKAFIILAVDGFSGAYKMLDPVNMVNIDGSEVQHC